MTQDNALTARFNALQDRLNLDDKGMADYLGVSVHTWIKWRNGTRIPGAGIVRLLDVLGMIEITVPELHEKLINH